LQSSQPHHDLHVRPEHQRRMASAVMRRQLALSVQVAAVFLIMLFGLPLFNYFFPDLANRKVFGFTASWFFLGVLFYPLTWILSGYFIARSNAMENDIARTLERGEARHDQHEAGRHD